MPEITREEKLKLIEKLPPRLQEFIYSEDTGAALLYLGQKYNLPDEKVHLLSKLTGDVVLGIKQVASLAQEINSNILSDAKIAMDLARELYSDILAPALTPATPVPPPTTMPRPVAPPAPSTDHYREQAAGSPEVVNLRKAPPIVVAPKIPLIEAEPHKASIPVPVPEPLSRMPQIILRSPGLPPAGSPRDTIPSTAIC
jgi:hypothetical protein